MLADRIFDSNASRVIAWFAFIGGIVGWPVSAFTIFSAEPQGILALSWLAIIYTGYQILQLDHAVSKNEDNA